MKVIHVPYSYYPDPVGGTEVYVESLARGLREAGIDSVICAPGGKPGSYVHEDLEVRRFTGDLGEFTLEMGYEADRVAAKQFGRILDAERPSVVHIHALTSVVAAPLALEVKMRGIPLVFTYHDCMATCQSGTLQRFERSTCDGRLDSRRCASCNLHRLGLAPALASGVAGIPEFVGRFIAQCGVRGRAWTALRMRELVARRHSWVRAFLGTTDAIVAPVAWVSELLIRNGVPASKIVLCPQGYVEHALPTGKTPEPPRAGAVKIVALSRVDVRKGIEVLLEALACDPHLDISLDIYLVRQDRDESHARRIEDMAASDVRVRLLPALAHSDVVATMRRYHALAVPSQSVETGPLVVLEAFAAGIPVIGSDVRGISDRVVHGRNGLLVQRDDPKAWAAALRRFTTDSGLAARLSLGIEPPLGMAHVSDRMGRLYRHLVEAQALRPRASDAATHAAAAVREGAYGAA